MVARSPVRAHRHPVKDGLVHVGLPDRLLALPLRQRLGYGAYGSGSGTRIGIGTATGTGMFWLLLLLLWLLLLQLGLWLLQRLWHLCDVTD